MKQQNTIFGVGPKLIAALTVLPVAHLLFRRLRFIAARLSHTRYYRRYTAPGVSLSEIHKK